MSNSIPLVDIFAGPGGLGEGFASLLDRDGKPVFKTVLAAEMDGFAHKTLVLRNFFRQFGQSETPSSYYDYVVGKTNLPYTASTKAEWDEVLNKVLNIELGTDVGDMLFDERLTQQLKNFSDWILIGGPPCQAYSTIHRWKYKTSKGQYDLDGDHRSRLYREYLRIIKKFSPSIFVMENVRGLLSLDHFEWILRDFDTMNSNGHKYKIYSLVAPIGNYFARDFLVFSENYGVPQKRHRVILFGVRDDIAASPAQLKKSSRTRTVSEAIAGLPSLRSGISKGPNSDFEWSKQIELLGKKYYNKNVVKAKKGWLSSLRQRSSIKVGVSDADDQEFIGWISDAKLDCALNHETRGHMVGDLERYFFAAKYSQEFGKSPKDTDFPDELSPRHKSWQTKKFSDRFRVQCATKPANTIVSHISKDGHSFIHPDPWQCRSLTVREAARIQTFPDNYFFEGPRTEQYKQVGNAVPPLLAYQIAEIAFDLLDRWNTGKIS